MGFVILNDLLQVVEGGGDIILDVGLEIDCKEDLFGEFEFKLVFVLGKRKDIFDLLWNDEVIYSDVEGSYGFVFEEMSMMYFGEVEYIVSDDNVLVNID